MTRPVGQALPPLRIEGYAFDAAASAAYRELAVALQQHEPSAILEPRRLLLARFAPTFPFYRAPGNRHRHFAVRAGGRLVGHVSALVNAALHDSDGEPLGLVGNFACEADYHVAEALLGRACEWLREAGLRRVWGPVDYDIWHAYRFMVRGFGEEAFAGEPRNPPWYPAYFERFGFTAWRHWISRETCGVAALEEGIAGRVARADAVRAAGYSYAPLDVNSAAQLQALHGLLVAALAGFPGVTPYPYALFAETLARFLERVDTRLVTLLLDPGGVPAGFAVAYPDISPALRAMRGRDGWLARLAFAWRRRAGTRVLFYLLGIAPAAAAGQPGLGSALFHHVMRRIIAAGYDRVLFTLLDEAGLSWRLSRREAAAAQRRYALYRIVP